jgi:GNAT superfamily N-acetyltransferase
MKPSARANARPRTACRTEHHGRRAEEAFRRPQVAVRNMSSHSTLLPSQGLIRRTIEIETAYTLSRLQVLERIPGNPIGVAYQKVDDRLCALMARHLPSPDFNRVTGLGPGHEQHIGPLAAWYRANGAKGRFEIVPGEYDENIGRELARQGYFHSGFHISVIGDPHSTLPSPNGVAVERVTSSELMEEYLDAYVAGWSIPEQFHDQFKRNVRPWRHEAGWTLYLARVDGHAAAAATLYVADGVGYFADAATSPPFRGRGVQYALLLRRFADARAADVDFVCSGAAFLSTSHRNMARIGMKLQFVRAIWTPL